MSWKSRSECKEELIRKADNIWIYKKAEIEEFFGNLFDWFMNGEIDVAEVDNLLRSRIPILTKEDRAKIIQMLLDAKHELEIEGVI